MFAVRKEIWIAVGEFGNVFGRKRRIDDHDIGFTTEPGDRREVAGKGEIGVFIERRVDRVAHPYHQQRVTLGRRVDDNRGG